MKKIGKRGDILTKNVIFIVLNLVYLSILIIFLFSKIEDSGVLEEKYSKQIALMIDAAEPGMIIHLNMEDAIEKAVKNGKNPANIISINNNIVTVSLSGKGTSPESSYSFFNDVEVNANFDTSKGNEYFFVINKK